MTDSEIKYIPLSDGSISDNTKERYEKPRLENPNTNLLDGRSINDNSMTSAPGRVVGRSVNKNKGSRPANHNYDIESNEYKSNKNRNKNKKNQIKVKSNTSSAAHIAIFITLTFAVLINLGVIIADLCQFGFQHFNINAAMDDKENRNQSGWLLSQITFILLIDVLLMLIVENRKIYNYINIACFVQLFIFIRLLFVATFTALNWSSIITVSDTYNSSHGINNKMLYVDGILLLTSSFVLLVFFVISACSSKCCRTSAH